MSDIITFADMKLHYDGEWVLISYKKTDENLQVVKGKVLDHSPNKEYIYFALKYVVYQPLANVIYDCMP